MLYHASIEEMVGMLPPGEQAELLGLLVTLTDPAGPEEPDPGS